jgi:hypothetical protein
MTRRRDAATPADIPVVGGKDVAFRVKDEIAKDRVGLLAAGVAFHGLLALFPAITAAIAISGLLIEPSRILAQLSSLSGLVPEDVIAIVTRQATAVSNSRQSSLGFAAILGLLIAFYSASKGMASLMQGLNIAYDEQELRGFTARLLVTSALTLLLIAGLVCGDAGPARHSGLRGYGPGRRDPFDGGLLGRVDRTDHCRALRALSLCTVTRDARVEMDIGRRSRRMPCLDRGIGQLCVLCQQFQLL